MAESKFHFFYITYSIIEEMGKSVADLTVGGATGQLLTSIRLLPVQGSLI
jgi:hypothetical protein